MLDHFGIYIIIRINEGNVFAGSLFDTVIACGRKSLVFLIDNFDTGIFLSVLLDDI